MKDLFAKAKINDLCKQQSHAKVAFLIKMGRKNFYRFFKFMLKPTFNTKLTI